jgi:hypothetical protein
VESGLRRCSQYSRADDLNESDKIPNFWLILEIDQQEINPDDLDKSEDYHRGFEYPRQGSNNFYRLKIGLFEIFRLIFYL